MAGLLDNDFLAQLDYLYVVAKEGFLTRANAQRVSRKFGVGLEYADHREYAPGDDFRYIDWQVYSRLDRLVVKLFSEEQELALYLLVDASVSMGRGDPSKLLHAKRIAAALGYISLSSQDRVVVVPFAEEARAASPAITGRGRRLELLRFLEGIESRGTTDLRRALSGFVSHHKRRGLVVLISDFFDDSYSTALRLLHHNGFDCMLVQVNDRAELDPPVQGDVELVDCESGESVSVRLTPRVREIYAEERERHYGDLRRLARAFDQGHFATVSDQPLETVIFDVFRRSGFLR